MTMGYTLQHYFYSKSKGLSMFVNARDNYSIDNALRIAKLLFVFFFPKISHIFFNPPFSCVFQYTSKKEYCLHPTKLRTITHFIKLIKLCLLFSNHCN